MSKEKPARKPPLPPLTRDQRLLDQAVAQKVFGKSYEEAEGKRHPRYSTTLTLAWSVVERTSEQGWVWEITNMHDGVYRWHARVSYIASSNEARHVAGPWARGDSVAEAICRAATLAGEG